MSILIIGGDQISQISSMLTQMGAKTINHWDARKKSSAPKKKSTTRYRLYSYANIFFKPQYNAKI